MSRTLARLIESTHSFSCHILFKIAFLSAGESSALFESPFRNHALVYALMLRLCLRPLLSVMRRRGG